MDSYTPLLERTRVPQPSIQSYAVISIFDKFRSSPPHLIDAGREAIAQCLLSSSPAVVDQSVRQLCRLVIQEKFKLSDALMELQSALEASQSRFVDVFVKALGFLVRLGFRNHPHSFRFSSSNAHPFVKVHSAIHLLNSLICFVFSQFVFLLILLVFADTLLQARGSIGTCQTSCFVYGVQQEYWNA